MLSSQADVLELWGKNRARLLSQIVQFFISIQLLSHGHEGSFDKKVLLDLVMDCSLLVNWATSLHDMDREVITLSHPKYFVLI